LDPAAVAKIVRNTVPRVLTDAGCTHPAPRKATVPIRLAKYVAFLKALRPGQADLHEADMERAMRTFFGKQAKSITAAMSTVAASPATADLLYRAAEWEDKLKEAARPPLERAVLTGYLTAKSIAEDRDKQVKATELAADLAEGTFLEGWVLPETVKAGIEAAVETVLIQPYWEKILATTGRQLAGTLARAMDEEWSEADLRHQIARDIGDKEGVRSKLIARTEMTGAMNSGHQVQMMESEAAGFSVIKTLISVGDILVRETHQEANGQEVRGANAMFLIGGYEAPWPGHWSLPAEERCGCRCATLEDLAELREGGFTEKPQLVGNDDNQLDIQVPR
jgi:hypothetical protein